MMLTDIVKHLQKTREVTIITHITPDGDALGSSAALGLSLIRMGKKVTIVKNDEIPLKYDFLPGQFLFDDADIASLQPDTLVVLDCGDLERLGDFIGISQKASTVINIDHHISNTMFGNLNLVDANAAATAELIYQIIKLLGVGMDLEIATCIFTAIASDTGCFKYDNTTSVTHGIAGELTNIGVETGWICSRIFNMRTLGQTKLLGKAIDSIRIYHGGKTAVMSLTKVDLEEFGCDRQDIEGIIEFARDIEGVEVAVLLKETEDEEVRVGLRSNEYVDTSVIAAVFNGGGHKKASGCTIHSSIDKACEMLLAEIEKGYR
jgi:phosphoesterase RecJ-like protein